MSFKWENVRLIYYVSLLHAHFNVCHYFMILCHFDQMNDIMMFFSFY